MKKSRIFVTTDTHGELDKLRSCLNQANFDYELDTLIHLGDCVDRGPNSAGVIDLLLKVKHLIAIRGNHDSWMEEFIETGKHPAPSYFSETANSYRKGLGGKLHPVLVPLAHQAFFRKQQNYYIDDQHRLFVHAGIHLDEPIEDQDSDGFYWDRDFIKKAMSSKASGLPLKDINNFKQIFIGHTPTLNWKIGNNRISKPIYAAQVVDLDTGGAYGYKISLLDITTDDHVLYQNI